LRRTLLQLFFIQQSANQFALLTLKSEQQKYRIHTVFHVAIMTNGSNQFSRLLKKKRAACRATLHSKNQRNYKL